MKKVLSTVLLLSLFLVSGCGDKEIDESMFNSIYSSHIDSLSSNLDSAMADYLSNVPETVDENTEVVFTGTYYDAAISDLDFARRDLDAGFVIADKLKQENVEIAAEEFFVTYEDFFNIYKEAVDFYTSGEYMNEPEQIGAIEDSIINAYYEAAGKQQSVSQLLY